MKKIILFSLLIAISLLSCSKDELKGTVTYKVLKPASVTSLPENIQVEFTDHFDLSVTYRDVAGKMVTEEKISLPWTKSFTVVAPYTAFVEMKATLKEGVTLTNEVCDPNNMLRLFVEAEGTRMRPDNGSATDVAGSGKVLSKSENIEKLINKNNYNLSFDFNREKLDWWKKGAGE